MMKWSLSCAVVCCLMAAHLLGQDAPPVGAGQSVLITSPNKFARDKKILLQVTLPEAVKARMKWWVRSNDGKTPPDFEVFNEGKTCAVWAEPGNYEALVTVGVIEANDILWFDVEHKFVVGDGPPPPPPADVCKVCGKKPCVCVVPPPPPPSDFGDVIGKVKELAGPIKDPAGKTDAAKIIAAAYRKHGALAASGEYKDQNVLADATSSEFVYELGLNRYVKWKPMMSRLREHMTELMKAGKLKDKDMKAWAALWEQYALGFDAVAQEGGTSGSSN
jgi:hypothetical protein